MVNFPEKTMRKNNELRIVKGFEVFFVREDRDDCAEEGLLLPLDTLHMLLNGEDLTDKIRTRASEPLDGGVGALLLPDAEVPVRGVVEVVDGELEEDREASADGGGVVPGQPAPHSVHEQDANGHHGHGQPRQPASMSSLSDLRHKDLDVGRVSGGCEADQEPSCQHHPEVLGRGAQDPAKEVGERENHQGHSPTKLLAEVGGDQTSKDGAQTEHCGYP